MKLNPIRSYFDNFLAFHFFIQIYGNVLMVIFCNYFRLECSINQKSYFLIGVYLLILGQKIKREGANFPLLISIFVELSTIFSVFHIFPSFFYILANLFYICYLLSLYFFQSYEIPFTPIPYKVGYRKLILDGCDDILLKNIAVFYPTEETTEDVAWLPDENILKIFFENHPYLNHFKGFFFFSVSFLHEIKLGVNLNSKIADLSQINYLEKGKYPVIVFSHGLGLNKHSYSIFAKSLASQGAIVFCTEHNDGIVTSFKPQLQSRYEVIKGLLDFIYDPKKIEEVFQEKIRLDYDKISIGGHSFGGGTAIYSCLFEKRITGGVLALDPFVAPIDDQLLNLKWENPTLCICTERFNKVIAFTKNHEKIENLLKLNKKNKNQNLFCYLKNSSHLQQGDIVCLFPRIMKLLNIIDWNGIVGDQLEFNLKLLELFFSDIVCQNKDIELVKEKFWIHVKEKMKLKEKESIKFIL